MELLISSYGKTGIDNSFIIVLLLINMAAFSLQTFESVATQHKTTFIHLEIVSVPAFTVEYILRVLVADLGPMYEGPIVGRLRYMFTNLLAVIDLVAILPFYLPGVIPFDLLAIRVLHLFRLARLVKLARYSEFDLLAIRVLHLFRLARLVKLARYSDSLDLIVRVITKQREFLLITFTIQRVLLLVSAAIMFYLGHEAQPQKFQNIFSALLWVLAGKTSLGYADIYPVTPIGRAADAVMTFIEIVATALPIGAITAGIEQEMSIVRKESESRQRAGHRKALLLKPGKRT